MTNLPTVAAAAAAATAAAVATATAAATTRLVLGFVDAKCTPVHFLTVQVLDHGGKVVVIDFDETEATGTARLAVHDQRNGVNRAMLSEQLFDVIFGRAEGQVAHINLLQVLFSKCRLAD